MMQARKHTNVLFIATVLTVWCKEIIFQPCSMTLFRGNPQGKHTYIQDVNKDVISQPEFSSADRLTTGEVVSYMTASSSIWEVRMPQTLQTIKAIKS